MVRGKALINAKGNTSVGHAVFLLIYPTLG